MTTPAKTAAAGSKFKREEKKQSQKCCEPMSVNRREAETRTSFISNDQSKKVRGFSRGFGKNSFMTVPERELVQMLTRLLPETDVTLRLTLTLKYNGSSELVCWMINMNKTGKKVKPENSLPGTCYLNQNRLERRTELKMDKN